MCVIPLKIPLKKLLKSNYLNSKVNKDTWKWFLIKYDKFTVKELKILIDEKVLEDHGSIIDTRWNKIIPRKVNIFIWQLRQRRVPVRVILDHMGIDSDYLLCSCCQEAVDTLEYCFVRCKSVVG